MSIVEHALDKARADQGNGGSRRTGDRVAQRSAGRTKQAAAIDPTLRIRPRPVALDMDLCRERRLLVSGAAESDGGAVAAYRMLRTRLLHRARANQWTTIAVTSADPNDGKTLTAINLAISMAREKTREIVLLDMDMRNPSICRTLGINPAHELRHYLETGEGGKEMFVSVCSDNLMLAGSVTPTESASELLGSARFDDLIQLIKKGTVEPIILIDLPPVLVTDDALVVAPQVDAILVVTSEGLTSRSDLARALDLLSEFKIAGLVLNRATDTVPDYNYGYDFDGPQGAADKGVR
jgi:Mrp family chromosome partitioning ATPase